MKIRYGILLSINKYKDIKNGTFVIPNNVTEIGRNVFSDCKNLTSIVIPDSVTRIGSYAFYNCTGLTSVTIPDSVTSIGLCAFADCSSLTSIAIPDGVTSISCGAFKGCTELTSITIPKSMTSVGTFAFFGCNELKNATIPKNVKSIGHSAFYGCSKLTKTDSRYYYKAFNKDSTCLGLQYYVNKWFECDGEIKLCKNWFYACKNAFDLFDYYHGELNKDIVIYKVELEGISEKIRFDSKVAAKRIRLVEKVNSYAELLN